MDVVFELMDALKAPVMTHSSSWADAIPKRVLDIIPQARLQQQIQKISKATIPEASAFLMTRSFEAPMDHDWTEIFIHVSCKTCQDWFNEDHWDKVQAPRTLNRNQTEMLDGLLRWIFDKRRIYLKQRLKENKEPVKIIAPTPSLKAGADYTQLQLF